MGHSNLRFELSSAYRCSSSGVGDAVLAPPVGEGTGVAVDGSALGVGVLVAGGVGVGATTSVCVGGAVCVGKGAVGCTVATTVEVAAEVGVAEATGAVSAGED
jgi:hypothetical protein